MKDLFSKENRIDLLVGLITLLCLVFSSSTFAGFMPGSVTMAAITLFIAAFSVFAVLIWRERPRDEREAHILLSSDRLGFLTGALFLSIALVVQSIREEPTTIIVLTLGGMVLAKLIGKYLHN